MAHLPIASLFKDSDFECVITGSSNGNVSPLVSPPSLGDFLGFKKKFGGASDWRLRNGTFCSMNS